MKNITLIDSSLKQYLGNLHTHTTRSDGKFDVAQIKKLYKDAGLSFVAITDHEIYFDSDCYDDPDFLLLSGVESSVLMNDRYRWIVDYWKKTDESYRGPYKYMHFGILKNPNVQQKDNYAHDQRVPRPLDRGIDSWNDFIADAKSRGNLVIVNHPHWSRMAPEELLGIQGAIAVEVYNSEDVLGCAGEGDEDIWDYCLNRGRKILAVAADDFHKDPFFVGKGFTVVCTDTLSRESVTKALADGNYYATSGPRMTSMKVEDGVLKMEFSPCREVRIVSFDRTGKSIFPHDGKLMTEAEWEIDTLRRWFRVELIDETGCKAWMQPVFIEDLLEPKSAQVVALHSRE